MDYEGFLAHYGKRGMKWGVRKDAVGSADLTTTQGGVRVFAKKDTPVVLRKDVNSISKVTDAVRLSMLKYDTGVFSSKGTMQALNEKWSSTFDKGPLAGKNRVQYNKEAEKALEAHANKSVPKGLRARVIINEDSMTLLVGREAEVNDLHTELSHSDSTQTMFLVVRDSNGFIIEMQPSTATHADDLGKEVLVPTDYETFLAHHGIKGMRWGVRRKDPSGGSDAAGAGSTDKPAADLHVSADAERFIRTHQKAGVEMSDREIKEAIQRANNVKQYNDIFTPDGNKELRAKVEALQLKAKMTELTKKPSKLDRVNNLIATSSKGFEAFDKLNKATGGDLQKKLAFTFDMSQAGIMARSLAAHDAKFDSRKSAVTAVPASTKSSLAKSAELRKQVDELLKIGTDGTVQLDLLDL